MLLKSCARCKALIPYGKTYCDTCKPIVDTDIERRKAERFAQLKENKRAYDREYNKRRDPKYVRFYNSKEWRMLSAKYSQDKGYRCEDCGQIASEVHHIKAIQTPDGWDQRLDYENLRLLCKTCHNERHDRNMKRLEWLKRNKKS